LKKTLKYISISFIGILAFATLLGHANIGNQYAKSKNKDGFKTISIQTEELSVFQKGKGKDILFIHGTPGSINDWTALIDSLSINYRVTSFDRPGHGFSTANRYNYHLGENASVVLEIIKKLDLQSPLIVGHSYGGSTAVHLAANHQLDSCEFIIIDSPLYEIDLQPIYVPLTFPVIGKGFAFLANSTIASSFIENGVRKAITSLPEEKLNSIIEERKKIWLQPKVLFSRANESSNYTSDLKEISPLYSSINANMTIVTGDNASITFKEDCTRFHEEVSGSELVVYKNTGHYIQFDKSNEVLELIKQKLKGTKSLDEALISL